MEIRDAQKDDASALAYLINLAGEGIPEFLWSQMCQEGELPLAVGSMRAAREEGSFSYTNARVCVEGDELLGMALAYRQPDPYDVGNLSDYPAVVRPLVELEAKVPGSWYLNAIATYPEFRGRGVARRLIQDTEAMAKVAGCKVVSLIVASENNGAVGLYEYLGYTTIDSLPLIAIPDSDHGGEWLLMTKPILS